MTVVDYTLLRKTSSFEKCYLSPESRHMQLINLYLGTYTTLPAVEKHVIRKHYWTDELEMGRRHLR